MEIKTKQLWDQTFYPESSRLLRNLGSRRSLLNAKDSYENITNPRDKKLIKKAGIELMGEDLFAQFINSVGPIADQTFQDKIDKKSLEFIEVNEKIKATEEWGNFADIECMSLSTILISQEAEIDRLAKLMLPDYWLSTPPSIDNLNQNQKNAVEKMIKLIFGERPADITKRWTEGAEDDFSETEQGFMDEFATKFITKYSADSDKIARENIIPVIHTDPMMPKTELSEKDYRDWKAIVDHIVGDVYWKYLSDDDITLDRFEWNLVMWLGEEFFPSLDLFIQYTEGTNFNNGVGKGNWKGPYIPVQQNTFTENEQKLIDESTKAFLKKYPDLNRVTPKSAFDKVAVISHMPDTKITETLDEKVLDINKFRL